jgi:competence protein ComEC
VTGAAERPVRPALPETPAAWGALALVAGIALGSRSVEGEMAAVLLAVACAAFALFRLRPSGSGGRGFDRAARLALLLLAAALGFALGRVRIARPAEAARRAFGNLQPGADRADRVEGVLADFWSGDAPHAHGRLKAERLWDPAASKWVPFPADVFLFLSGEEPAAATGGDLRDRAGSDRGDRVVIVGKLRAEGPPVSDRDITAPWPLFRLSIKSALRIEASRATWLSVLCAPNRWLYSRFPPVGSRGPGFERDVRGPLAALLLGRTAELDRGMVARYRRGGMYHLLVIAGLHVGLAAGIVLALLRGFGVRGRRRDALLTLTVLLFVLVGGANPPAVRAGIVFGVYALTRLLERPVAPGQTVGLSALVLFCAAPEQIYAIGTVLTFAAVAGIAAFGPLLRDLMPWRPRFVSGFAAAVAAQIGTAPALLWRFNVVSAGAWLTAPVTIPLAGLLIALGAALLVLFALGLPFGPVAALFATGSRGLELFAERMAGMAVLRPTPSLAAVTAVAALLGAGVLARDRSVLRRAAWACAAALFLILAVSRGPSGPERGFSLEALDVGQGDAILLRWGRHALLVDGGGPLDGHARDFGRTRLLPKLLDRGVTRLDAVLLTHPHPDHAVGLFAILEELPVGAFWTSSGSDENGFHRDLGDLAREKRVPVRALRTGSSVRWRDARLDVLLAGGERSKRDATNNESVVARFTRDGRSALLTGDAGAAAESRLLRSGRAFASDLLKVGHHGSRGGSTPAFLAAVAPRAALVSCGRENRFGHPAPETLASLGNLGVRLFRTDRDSDVRVDLLPGATRVLRRDLP